MHSTTVAVDLAKNVFELAVADSEGKIGERLRLNRARFSSFFVHRAPCRGSSHYWARRIGAHGHAVQLLPAQYVRQYVRRNKTDRADAASLIEAARCAGIRTVPAKSLEQQQFLVLHRLRSQWMNTRQRYLNTLRGLLREFGIAVPLGARIARTRIAQQDMTAACGHRVKAGQRLMMRTGSRRWTCIPCGTGQGATLRRGYIRRGHSR